jgi:hypothetical protein
MQVKFIFRLRILENCCCLLKGLVIEVFEGNNHLSI